MQVHPLHTTENSVETNVMLRDRFKGFNRGLGDDRTGEQRPSAHIGTHIVNNLDSNDTGTFQQFQGLDMSNGKVTCRRMPQLLESPPLLSLVAQPLAEQTWVVKQFKSHAAPRGQAVHVFYQDCAPRCDPPALVAGRVAA